MYLESKPVSNLRVLSGMRPTGSLHLGHYFGVLMHWKELLNQHSCYFFVADWHALTTDYECPKDINEHAINLVSGWIASGIDPNHCNLFVQSWVKEHAELYLLLSMITPISWLERIPSYKDQIENMKDKSLDTVGFLSYPVLQAADILLYKAELVPVGKDQVPHIEFARELARRFNFLYSSGDELNEQVEDILVSMPTTLRERYLAARRLYREQGNESELAKVTELIKNQKSFTVSDRERLLGYFDGGGQKILPEPDESLLPQAKLLGLDGKKMSKSLGNTIPLASNPNEIAAAFASMPTDPARVKRNDPGNPHNCPVFDYHEVASTPEEIKEIVEGCTTAKIGCVDCKAKLSKTINFKLEPVRASLANMSDNRDTVRDILKEGSEKARSHASETIAQLRDVMKLTV